MKKGHDYIGVGVTFFCHDGTGRFVMGRRSKNARDEQGLWDLGGGGVEMGENAEDAVRREVREEYGADVIACEFLGYMDVHREQGGMPTHWISLVFKALVDPAQIRNAEPHTCDEVRWFTLDDMPEGAHSQLPRFLELYRDRLP
jgi:ADP-ribose pyrophosphatase YjhB (NUDIX family)